MLLLIIITAIAVSIDGMVAGFAYGVGKISVPIKSLALIALIPVGMTFCAMCFTSLFIQYVSDEFISIFGFCTMLVLAFFSFRQYLNSKKQKLTAKPNVEDILANPVLADVDKEMNITLREGVLVGFAVGIDASAGCVALALMGASIILTPIMAGLAHFVLIGVGNYLGRVFNKKAEFLRIISVFLFIILAFVRLFA